MILAYLTQLRADLCLTDMFGILYHANPRLALRHHIQILIYVWDRAWIWVWTRIRPIHWVLYCWKHLKLKLNLFTSFIAILSRFYFYPCSRFSASSWNWEVYWKPVSTWSVLLRMLCNWSRCTCAPENPRLSPSALQDLAFLPWKYDISTTKWLH